VAGRTGVLEGVARYSVGTGEIVGTGEGGGESVGIGEGVGMEVGPIGHHGRNGYWAQHPAPAKMQIVARTVRIAQPIDFMIPLLLFPVKNHPEHVEKIGVPDEPPVARGVLLARAFARLNRK
jgi:hypothetical protein